MKQPPYTTEPLVGSARRSGLRELLLGHLAADACYEAHRDDNGVYILWMEFSRFGTLRTYPCVIHERDAEPLVFGVGGAEGDSAFFARWQTLVTPESFSRFRWGKLEKSAFKRIYRAYRSGEA